MISYYLASVSKYYFENVYRLKASDLKAMFIKAY